MKYFYQMTMGFLLLGSQQVNAGTKLQKVKLDDEKITIIRAEIDSDNMYYHMDSKACLCWLSSFPDISNPISIATIDCKNLGVYSKFSKAVEACQAKWAPKVEGKAEAASEGQKPAVASEETSSGPTPASVPAASE